VTVTNVWIEFKDASFKYSRTYHKLKWSYGLPTDPCVWVEGSNTETKSYNPLAKQLILKVLNDFVSDVEITVQGIR
jgi:hypothetical protein